jgi:alpha-glucosidase
MAWRAAPDGVLDFERGDGFRCVVNVSGTPVPLEESAVLLTSLPLEDGALPRDAAAWLRA